MRKLLSMIIVISMLITSLSAFAVNTSAETDSGSCGENLTWEYDSSTDTLTISGTGDMDDFIVWDYLGSYVTVPWENTMKTVTIGNGVTSIGKYAFSKCASLTSITIPDSVTSIGCCAFYECTSLTTVTIGNSVTSIGDETFSKCTSLTSITIPDSVKSIGEFAFSDCASLTSVTIPNSVTRIDRGAFAGCNGLTSITIGNSVTSIGDSAFYGCNNLCDVYYDGLESQWNKISISDYNESIRLAKVHFACDIHGHTNTDYPVALPTCRTVGYTVSICSVCGNTEHVFEPFVPHKYEKGKCIYCGEAENGAGGDVGGETDTDSPAITVSDNNTVQGGTVSVDVFISDNPGINTFSLSFDYDREALNLTGVEISPDLGGQFVFGTKAVWLNESDVAYNGKILTLTFSVSDDAQIGDYSVSVSCQPGDIVNYDEDSINFETVSGVISVSELKPGDINGDGTVNNKDLNRFMKYFAGQNVEVIESTLDTNGDGAVNSKDLTRLLKYLAGVETVIF